MTMQLSLVYGSTTVTLQGSDCVILDGYYPTTPTSKDQKTVTEKFSLKVPGGTTAIRAKLAAIQKALDATTDDRRTVTPVFVHWSVDATTAYRAKVFGGAVQLTTALLADWRRGSLTLTLVLERTAFWEAADWVAVPLSNGNGTDLTSGINIYNCNDGTGTSPNKKNNYVDIDGVNDITGELPAPVKIKATTGNDAQSHFIYALQADLQGFGLVSPYGEAEDWTLLGGGAATGSGASFSHAHFFDYDLPVLTTKYLYYDIDLSAYSGGYYKFFINGLAKNLTDLKVKFQITQSTDAVNYATLDETDWVHMDVPDVSLLASPLSEIGDLRLPPARSRMPASGTLATYRLQLAMYSGYSVGTRNANMDVFYWLPTDAYVEIGTSFPSMGMYSECLIYAEGLEPLLYKEESAGGGITNYFDIKKGSGLFLRPGVNQRLHFLSRESMGMLSSTEVYNSLQMWYKPRKVTL